MDRVEDMNYAKSACWVFSGLMLVASEGHAQEAGQDARQKIETEIQKPAGSDADEKMLLDAEALIKAGKPAEAYNLLEPLEFDRSGEVRFDYLLGIAALDSGKPDKATLAFERVLAEDPEYAGARLEMARAYYQLGDLSRAKTEFEVVSKQNPSEATLATIERYMNRIEGLETSKKTHINGYIEGTIGRDTNVNNASEFGDNLISPIPNQYFGELADNYWGAATGIEINHTMSSRWRLYAGADLVQRNNFRYKTFDTLSNDERFGLIYATNANLYRVGMLAGQNTMGSTRYRNNAGINAEWRHAFGSSNQLNIFGQYMEYRFVKPAMQSNDINQMFTGAGWLHEFGNAKSTLSISMYYGMDNDVGPVSLAFPSGGGIDGAKRFGGLRVGGQATSGGRVKLYFSAGEQIGEFDKINPTISANRKDHLDDMTVGAYWYLDPLWTVNLQFTRYINMSNVEVSSYDRSDYSLTIRRNF